MLNQESTPTNIQPDLHDARALLERAGSDDEKKRYRKAAELILMKALRLDPQNEEVKILLQSVRTAPVSSGSQPSRPTREEVPFNASPALFQSVRKDEKKKPRPKLIFGLIAMIALGGGLMWILQSHRISPNALAASLARTPSVTQQSVPAPVADTQEPAAPPPDALLPAAPETPVPTAAAFQTADPALSSTATVPPAMGKLAVSSTTAADIFQGDRNLGSTPTTLQLPAGRQTLEFRAGDLRTTISYDIKSNETATASVTFQTTVQINARPWAQVFLDGAPRRPLGQTPLSGVSVPIGGVLVFENPNFESKTHRITQKDSAIQVDFP